MSAQHLRIIGRGYAAGSQVLVPFMESIRPQFQRWWGLRRNSDLQGQDVARSVESSR
jgi:hypothetical protein